jgi:hypothetical protein
MPNEGLATAGIILSIIGLVVVVVQIIIGIFSLIAVGGLTALPICFMFPYAGTTGGY